MKEIFNMAGDIAAHSVWGVSSGETLIPILGSVDQNNQSLFRRIAFDSAEEAHQFGLTSLDKNESGAKGGAFSVDGYITLKSGKTDALILDVRVYGDAPGEATIAIPYRHAKSPQGFALFRPKLISLEAIDQSHVETIMNAFYEGLEAHEQGYEIWKKHFEDEGDAAANEPFSNTEWNSLLNAPFVVFFAVAASDGKIDDKEAKKLVSIIAASKQQANGLFQKILLEGSAHIPQFLNKLSRGGINVIEELTLVSELVDSKLSQESAGEFKQRLYAFAKQIAESSGGLFGFGSKISKEEKAALAAIALLLEIKP